MSSQYRVLCLSHDPAIVVTEPEWWEPEPALVAAAKPEAFEELRPHVGCDLLVGRYSYPLVEVGCPASPKTPAPVGHWPYHPHSAQWVDADWLRLLYHAYRGEGHVLAAANGIGQCWSRQRVMRLRLELGIEDVSGGD